MTKKRYTAVEDDRYIYPIFFDNEQEGRELSAEEIVELLNEQDQKIKELEQELFSTKVEKLDDRLAEYGGPDDEETWKKEFGMSQREAKKKAGWFDWDMYPE